jgi:hypothetical protein
MTAVKIGLVVAAVLAGAATAATSGPPKPRPGSVACEHAIDQVVEPSDTGRLVLGRVILPPESQVLQVAPAFRSGWKLFAKHGVVVSAGEPVKLEVPVGSRRNYALRYARDARAFRARLWGQTSVEIEPCPPGILDLHWTAFAGGFELHRPACIPLLVHAHGKTERVRLSVGKRCS